MFFVMSDYYVREHANAGTAEVGEIIDNNPLLTDSLTYYLLMPNKFVVGDIMFVVSVCICVCI